MVKAATVVVLIAMGMVARTADRVPVDQDPWPDDWWEKLSEEARQRLAEHKGGFTTHPPMMSSVMEVRYDPVYALPLATFHEALTADERKWYSITKDALYRNFNVQLVSPWHRVDFPMSATLIVDFSKNGASISLPIAMQLDMMNAQYPAYYIACPNLFALEISDIIESLGPFPTMTLANFEGFEFNEQTIEDMPPLGTPIIYNVRFGNVRVDTGFQWAGRPVGIPSGGTKFLREYGSATGRANWDAALGAIDCLE